MKKTVFEITQMDCPSEENLIRMKLGEISGIKNLDFDIPNRRLTVFHEGQAEQIDRSIQALRLGGRRVSTENTEQEEFDDSHESQKKLLWAVLIINFAFFVIEMTAGLLSKSMGLISDSLDMLADASVYGISLLAVGGSVVRKKRVASLAGYIQLLLAAIGFAEVLRRFFWKEQLPDFSTMMIVSALALVANGVCLYLLQKSKGKEEAHIKASMIFTSNDVVINVGVILAGLLVNLLNSNKPDLIIGAIVFAIVVQGAIRILRI